MSESSKSRLGDYNIPREEVSDVLREEDPEKSREDPHVGHDRKGRKRAKNQPRRAPTANKHTGGGGSAAKRLSRSRSKSATRPSSVGKPDYRYAYYYGCVI